MESCGGIAYSLKVETPPVPELSYGLDRVLFNPGVYHLQDPRSRVFNFDPYLGTIMPVTEFDFASLKDYITSSKDTTLRDIAAKHRKKYVGSSSSMTGVLSHFHYLLSQWRPINVQNLSQGFPDNLKTFTALLRAPAAVILRYQDGTYAIDADKEFDSANILMNLGKSMEKLLTLPKEEFERYRRSAENKITPEEEALVPESYHYSTQGDFLMRSQLDAYDPRLPGTGMFDLKTRAVVSIRMDARNFEKGLGYQIKSLFGEFESYEREYYDMIRAAFLKYSLQVRMGRMDGIFVAFHNVERIFGFQYISLPEMDLALHGQRETVLGHAEFRFSLKLWNKILNKATAKYPKRSLRFHFETRLSKDGTTYMNIFYEPVTDEQIEAIQNKNKADIDAYQQQILALEPKEDGQKNTSTLSEHPKDTEDAAETAPTASESSIDRVASPVEEGQMNSALSDDQATVVTKDPAASNVSAESESSVDPVVPSEEDGQDLSSALSDDQTTTKDTDATADNASTASESSSADTAASESKKPRELSGICLTVLNYHNDQRVERIENFKRTDSWTIRYQMSDLEGPNLHSFYESCQRRREQLLLGDRFESEAKVSPYIAKLWRLSKKGRQYREFIDKFDKEMGYRVVDQRAKS
ncbi:Pet127 family protein [Aspergillus undulatus]|uniref:Pet127 family protein n=1 Tax=Aspergillus undulatus TaxID=1810928 RepID=UPI003CCCA056